MYAIEICQASKDTSFALFRIFFDRLDQWFNQSNVNYPILNDRLAIVIGEESSTFPMCNGSVY